MEKDQGDQWLGWYLEAIRECELLFAHRMKVKADALRDALWSGAWQLRKDAAECLQHARDAGPVLLWQSSLTREVAGHWLSVNGADLVRFAEPKAPKVSRKGRKQAVQPSIPGL